MSCADEYPIPEKKRFKKKELTRKERKTLRKIYGSANDETYELYRESLVKKVVHPHRLNITKPKKKPKNGIKKWAFWLHQQKMGGWIRAKDPKPVKTVHVIKRADPVKLKLLGIDPNTVTRTVQWRELRTQAIFRDKRKCRICKRHWQQHNKRQFKFIMAHIQPRWAYPERTFDLENVVMLCQSCDQKYGDLLEAPEVIVLYT